MKISVIIPALNEGEGIGGVIRRLGVGGEVIVVDGGSSDDTCRRASDAGATVLTATANRGLQMDLGVGAATGEVLLFLHADTLLPDGWQRFIEESLSKEGVVGGAFNLRIDSDRGVFRFVESLVALRSKFFGLIYGDQAIFVFRETFLKVGGFRKLPLMEDVDCVTRLRKVGRMTLLSVPVMTSPRRWNKRGIFVTTLINSAILLLYNFGVSPERLYEWYYGKAVVKSAFDGGCSAQKS